MQTETCLAAIAAGRRAKAISMRAIVTRLACAVRLVIDAVIEGKELRERMSRQPN